MGKLHITKGSGKMNGIFSINTPTSTNEFCKMMSKTDTVCKSCYAMRFEAFRSNVVPALERNVKLLLSKSFVPEKFNSYKVMRLHSFGELHNYVHFTNFVKIALVNKDTTFTLWTKRKNIVQNYIKKGGVVPSNLLLIYSNPVLDNQLKRVPKGFNKVFNVFSKKEAERQNIKVNCGKKACLDCMLCYTVNKVEVINELKK